MDKETIIGQMAEKLRDEMEKEAMKYTFKTISYTFLLSCFALLASPFIYIWGNGLMASKIAATAILLIIVCTIVHQICRKAKSAVIEKSVEDLKSEMLDTDS